MEFLRDPKFRFMKYRFHWMVVSVALVLLSILAVFVHGELNMGIDFAGGTQVTLRFAERPEIEELRQVLTTAGFGDAVIQRYGDDEDNEVLIKTRTVEGEEEGSRERIVEALHRHFETGESGRLDLNEVGVDRITTYLGERDPVQIEGSVEEKQAYYGGVAEAILEVRRDLGILASWQELEAAAGVSPESLAALKTGAYLGKFAVLGTENVGPQIGRELRIKGILAVVMSLVGMLAYIWFRFELRFGIGAVVAIFHDVLVALGLFAVLDYEFNLTTIAAFLTLVGYSVNDSVVVFDRVRENMRKRRRESLEETMNTSVNQTLSRTILTSGTTFLVVATLFLWGGDVIQGFAFVLLVGVIVGTYSSIFIACPIALLWERFFGAEARAERRKLKVSQAKTSG